MKVWLENNEIKRISKVGDSSKAFGEFTGIAKFMKDSIPLIQEDILEISKVTGNLYYYMEEILQRDIEKNLNRYQLNYKTINENISIEIDFEEDLKLAQKVFKNRD